MASNRNNRGDSSVGQWIGIAVVFCIAWPIGLILAGIKLYKMYEAKQSSQAQKYWQQNWQQQSTLQTTRFQGGQQTTQQTVTYQRGQQTNGYPQYPYGGGPQQQRQDESQRQRLIAKLISPKPGRGMITGGTICLILGALATVVEFLEEAWMLSYGMALDLLGELTGGLILVAAGGILAYIGTRKLKKARKYREYFAVIGSHRAVSLRQLSSTTNTEFQDLCDDLTVLIEKGAFGPNAYLDLSTQHLIVDAAGAQEVENRRRSAAQAAEAAAAKKAEEEDPSAALLKEIRRVNDEIPDPRLSQQIDRIEEITRQILLYQNTHPESAPQLHSFLSYYLPTTLKILNAYADMEKQSIQGRNITETRLRIEKMMDKVVSGFENQLDQLYAGDRMDITSDISVLEQMMAQDGLTSDFDLGAQMKNDQGQGGITLEGF
jgi:hypothetical protein